MEPNKKKRGRPRKAAAPQTKTKPSPLYFAMAKAPEAVERTFRKLEALQSLTGGDLDKLVKLW